MRQEAVLADGVLRSAGIRCAGGGSAVAAPVRGLAIGPRRFHPPAAGNALQKPSGTGDPPGDYRSLVKAVAAAAAETGGPVTCVTAAERVGINVTGRQAENVRAKLKRLEDRGWLRRNPAGKLTIAP